MSKLAFISFEVPCGFAARLKVDTAEGTTTWTESGFRPTGLDTKFPDTTDLIFGDNPAQNLDSASTYSGQEWALDFTDYLMWDPEVGTEPIPVPLGYVSWEALGNATSNGSTWTVDKLESFNTANSFKASSSSWISWTSVATAGNMGTCKLYP